MGKNKIEQGMLDKQYKPGQSGNPSGKPKGTLNMATILKMIGEEEVTLKDGRKLPANTLILKKMYEMAAKGDMRAIKTAIEYNLGKPHQRVIVEGNEERPLNLEITNDYLAKLQEGLKKYKEKE